MKLSIVTLQGGISNGPYKAIRIDDPAFPKGSKILRFREVDYDPNAESILLMLVNMFNDEKQGGSP